MRKVSALVQDCLPGASHVAAVEVVGDTLGGAEHTVHEAVIEDDNVVAEKTLHERRVRAQTGAAVEHVAVVEPGIDVLKGHDDWSQEIRWLFYRS